METLYVHTVEEHNKVSAGIILPQLFSFYKPQSVVDIGCGLATWAAVCEDNGVTDVLAVDGDYVDRSKLEVAQSKFKSHDLRKPLQLDKKYDMAICLEVAEHLPESCADTLVDTLVNNGTVVLFSAAIPGQNGQHHINEQPFEYWEKKFNARGMYFYDLLRPVIWNDSKIDWWYRQNIFLVAPENYFNTQPSKIFTAVHPVCLHTVIAAAENANEEKSKLRQEYESGNAGMLKALKLFIKSLLKFKF